MGRAGKAAFSYLICVLMATIAAMSEEPASANSRQELERARVKRVAGAPIKNFFSASVTQRERRETA
jgi:hypothetical protein